MAESFARAWLPFLQSEGIKPEWENRYNSLVSQAVALDIEKETSEDESDEEDSEEQEKYDAFDLDD